MGSIIRLYPTFPKKRARRVFWITVPHGPQADQEPMASRTKRGALADIDFYDGHASVHKCVLAKSATKHCGQRSKRGLR
jgi:hypothetical protein